MAHSEPVRLPASGKYVRLYVDWTAASTRANILTGSKSGNVDGEALATSMGKIAKWYTDFKVLTFTDLTTASSGSGNAVTALSYDNTTGKLTFTKGSTFLTQHPTITTDTDTTSTASPGHGGTFTAIDSVTRDTNGHVKKVNTKTVTLPAQYSHPTYTRSNTTSTASPAHGGTFTVIDSITSNTLGHVTAVNTKTITLPADSNTDTKVTQSVSTTTNYRPLILGATNTTTVADLAATVTAQTYATTKIYAQPSTGNLYANTFVGKLYRAKGGSWINARDNAVAINDFSSTGESFAPIGFAKSSAGGWAIGTLSNRNKLYLSYTTDANYSSGTNTSTYTIEFPEASGTVALTNHTHDSLTTKTLTTTTLENTAGNFFFGGSALLGGINDWVGIQADTGNDKFQLIPNSGNVMYRQNDTGGTNSANWGAWVGLMSPGNVSGTGGITVTATTTTLGSGTSALTYNSGVQIGHSNSITAKTTYNMNKFKYDAQGHITESWYWVHAATGTGGQAGWIKIASFKIIMTYFNTPITLICSTRGNTRTFQISFGFSNANSTDPPLSFFETSNIPSSASNNTTIAYMIKSATSTWDLYILKRDNYESFVVSDLIVGKYFGDHITWTWKDEQVAASAITGGVAATRRNSLAMIYANGYWGMAQGSNDEVWIRTTAVGIIPYEKGGAGSGHQSLGTSTWYFSAAYIDNVYAGTFNENGTSLANKYIPKTGATDISGSLETNSENAGFISPGPSNRKMSLIGGGIRYYIGTGNWASGIAYYNGNTAIGQIGAYGIPSTCDYFYMGKGYNDVAMRVENDNTGKMTLRGTLPRLRFTQTTSGKAYDDDNVGITVRPANTSGTNMFIQSNGNMVIGAGEYPINFHNATKSGASTYPDYWSDGGEQMYVGSDNNVIIHTNANTIGNRKGFMFTTAGNLQLAEGGGIVFKYATSDVEHKLVSAATSTARTWTLPNATGTICLTSHNHDSTYLGINDNAVSATDATNSTNVYVTLTNPSSSTTYYLPFISNVSSGNKGLKGNNGITYSVKEGTTSATGVVLLALGNIIGSGTAGNKSGSLRMYGTSTGYTNLNVANTSTTNYTATLPNATGRVGIYKDLYTSTAAPTTTSETINLNSSKTIIGVYDILKVWIYINSVNNIRQIDLCTITAAMAQGPYYFTGVGTLNQKMIYLDSNGYSLKLATAGTADSAKISIAKVIGIKFS